MKNTGILLGSLFCLFCSLAYPVSAGDAVAMGYRYDGVWTTVTYNRSSTPKGGPHYRAAAQACAAALRDLRARGREDLVRTKIIGQSDRTGYVAVAQGKGATVSKDVTAIGRGKSQAQADQSALAKLNAAEAETDTKIVYRYFSYGADSKVHHNVEVRTARR